MAQKYKLLGFSSSGYTHDISALRLENYADQIDYMVFTGGNSSYNPAYVYDRKKGMQNIEEITYPYRLGIRLPIIHGG